MDGLLSLFKLVVDLLLSNQFSTVSLYISFLSSWLPSLLFLILKSFEISFSGVLSVTLEKSSGPQANGCTLVMNMVDYRQAVWLLKIWLFLPSGCGDSEFKRSLYGRSWSHPSMAKLLASGMHPFAWPMAFGRLLFKPNKTLKEQVFNLSSTSDGW